MKISSTEVDGDTLASALGRSSSELPAMLRAAGATDLAAQVKTAEIDAAVGAIAEVAAGVRAGGDG